MSVTSRIFGYRLLQVRTYYHILLDYLLRTCFTYDLKPYILTALEVLHLFLYLTLRTYDVSSYVKINNVTKWRFDDLRGLHAGFYGTEVLGSSPD